MLNTDNPDLLLKAGAVKSSAKDRYSVPSKSRFSVIEGLITFSKRHSANVIVRLATRSAQGATIQ